MRIKQKLLSVLKIIPVLMVMTYLGLFYAEKINLITLDLGRHIQNGAYFFNHFGWINTNYYSFTMPYYETINHHWGAGIIFYLITHYLGFDALSMVYIVISIITCGLFFAIAKRHSTLPIALIVTLLVLPLITYRTDFRPETFSLLFLGLYTFILFHYDRKPSSTRLLYLLPCLQILWVNCHIFFILGPCLIGTFIIKHMCFKRRYFQTQSSQENTLYRDESQQQVLHKKVFFKFEFLKHPLFKVLGLTLLACLINPNFISGLLIPFTIFNDYGYKVVENQSLLFMYQRFENPIFIHFMVISVVSVLSSLFTLTSKKRTLLFDLSFCVTFIILSCFIVRMIPISGYMMLINLSKNIYILIHHHRQLRQLLAIILLIVVTMGSIIGLTHQNPSMLRYYSPIKPFFGIGLDENTNNAARFIKHNHLKGPIFNNYDIGGYLIYHLFDQKNVRQEKNKQEKHNQEKVFVDNRPEAYPLYFFKNIYESMQNNSASWEYYSAKYQLNLIVFYRHDMTTWAQPFLIKRIKDPQWIPIYVDLYTLILIKNNEKNKPIISTYKLPNNMFSYH